MLTPRLLLAPLPLPPIMSARAAPPPTAIIGVLNDASGPPRGQSWWPRHFAGTGTGSPSEFPESESFQPIEQGGCPLVTK